MNQLTRLNIVILTIDRQAQLMRLLTSIEQELAGCSLRVNLFLSDNHSATELDPGLIRSVFKSCDNFKLYFRRLDKRVPFHIHYASSILDSAKLKSDFTWCLGDDDWLCEGSGRRLAEDLERLRCEPSLFLFLERIVFKLKTGEWKKDPIPSVYSNSLPQFLLNFDCGKIGVLSQVIFSSSILACFPSAPSIDPLFLAYPQLCIYAKARSFYSLASPYINYTQAPSLFGDKDYWVHCYECPSFLRSINASFIVRLRAFDWLRSILWRSLVLLDHRRKRSMKLSILSAASRLDLVFIVFAMPVIALFVLFDRFLCIASLNSKVAPLFKTIASVDSKLMAPLAEDHNELARFIDISSPH